MFVNFRRIHKVHFVRLLTTGLVLCAVMLCWEELDHHVVSHMRSYTYRYLINTYDFLNSSLAVSPDGQKRDIRDFSDAPPLYPFLINHPDKCAKDYDDVLLLLFIKSSPGNTDRRRAIRDTWGNESYIRTNLNADVKVLFVLGAHPDARQRSLTQRALQNEDWIYGDLIQQDFMDTFHNLTTKLILQFHWANKYCPKAKFVMSADDDILVHTPNLVRYMNGLLQKGVSNFWVGHVHRGSPPIRRKDSKYHVPLELYPWPSYPDYTAGAGYLVSGDVAAKIYSAMLVLNTSMYIDDVFMGMCAEGKGVSPQEHVYFGGEAKTRYHPCIYAHMITSHGHTLDVRTLWRDATDPGVQKMSEGFLANLYCTVVRVALLCWPHYDNTYSCKGAFT